MRGWLWMGLLAGSAAQAGDLPEALPNLRVDLGEGTTLRAAMSAQLRLDLAAAPGETAVALQPQLKRLRMAVQARFFDGDLSVVGQLSPVPGEVEWIDLYANGRLRPHLQVRAGVFKTPFTRYRGQSYTKLALNDWSVASRAFGGERQAGLMVHNVGEAGGWVPCYAVGVFLGWNSRASHGMGVADAMGAAKVHPTRWVDPSAPGPVHPEVVARLMWSTEGADTAQLFDREGGGLRFSAGLSGALDTSPDPQRDFTARFVPEVLLKAGHLSWAGVGYLGWSPGAEEHPVLGQAGLHTTVGWHVHRHLELAAQAAAVWRTAAMAEAVLAFGDDGGLGEGSTVEAGGAVQVPIFGDDLIWQLDGRWIGVRGPDVASADGWGARMDVQISL